MYVSLSNCKLVGATGLRGPETDKKAQMFTGSIKE